MNPVTKHPEFYVQNLQLISTPYDQSKVQEFVETFDKKALSRNLPNILDLFKELDEFEELIPPRPNQKPLRCPPPYNPRMARLNQFSPFGTGVGQGQSQFPPAVVPTPVTLPLVQQKQQQQQQNQTLADLNRPPQTPLSSNSMPQTPGSSSTNARSPKMRHMSTTSDTYGELETLQSLSHSFQSDMGSSQTNQNTPMGGLGSSSADSDSSSCAVTPVVESRATPIGVGGGAQSSGAAATALNDFPYHGERKSSLQDTIDSVVLATVSSANPQPSMSVNSPIMTSASSYDFSPRRRPSEASSVFDLRQTPSDDLIITSPTPGGASICGVGQAPSMMMSDGGSATPGQHLPSSQLQRTQRAASLPSQQQPQAPLDVFEFDQAAEQQQQQLFDPVGGGGSSAIAPTPHHRWSTPNIGVMGGYGGEPDFQAATMGYNPDGSMSGYMTYQDANQNPQFHQQLMRNAGDQSSMGAGGNVAAMRGAPGNGIRRRRSRRNAANVGDRTYEQALKEMKKAEKAALRGAKAPRRPRRPRGSSTIQSLAPGTSHADTTAKMRVKFYGNSGEMLGEQQNFSEETSSSFSSDANFSVGNPNSALSMEMQQQQQIRCQQQQQLNLATSTQRKDSFSNSSQMNQTAAYGNVPGTPNKEKDFSTISTQLQRHHSFDAAAVAFEHSLSLTSAQQQQQQLYRSDSQSQQQLQQHQMLQQRLFNSQGDAIREEQKRRAVKEDLAAPRVMDVESGDVFDEESDENDDETMMHAVTHDLTTQQASNLFENMSKTIPTTHGNRGSPSSVQQTNNASILSSTKRKGSILDDVIGKLTNRCQTSTGPFNDESSSSSISAMPLEVDIEPPTKRTKFDMQENCPTGKDCPPKSAATNFQLPQQSATINNNNAGARAPTPQQKMLAKQLSASSSGAGGDQSCSSSSTTSSEHSPATTSTTGLKLVIRKRDLKLIDQQQQQQQIVAGNNGGQSAIDNSQPVFSMSREFGSQNVSVAVRNVQTSKMTSATKQNSTSNMPDFAAARTIQNLQQQNQQQMLKRASPSILAAAENHVKQALAGGLTVQQMVQQRQQQDLNSAASLKFNDYKQKVQEKKLKKVVSVAAGSSTTASSVAAAANINNLNQSTAALLGFSALKAVALQHNLTPAESAKLTAKLLEKVQSAAGKTTKADNERKIVSSNQPQQQINVTSASAASISAVSSGSATDQSSVFPGTEGIVFSKTLTGYKIPRIEEKTAATAGGSSPAAASSSPHRKAPPFQPPSTSHFTAGVGQQTLSQQQSAPKKPKSILKNARPANNAASNVPLTFSGAEREPAPPAVGQLSAQQHFSTPPSASRADTSHSNAAAAAAAAVAAALNQQKRQPLLPDPSPAFFAAAAAAAASGGGDAAQQQAAMAAQVMSTFGAFLPMGTAARAAAATAPSASSSRSTPQRNEEQDFVLTTEAPASPDDM